MRSHTLHRLLGLIGLFTMGAAMAIEEPPYDTLIAQAPFELRHYAPTLVAQAVVAGDMDAASNQGFRLIADFIFGNNQVAGSEQAAKIAMTAPVTVAPQSAKVAMTAPVTVQPQAGGGMAEAQQWRVQFVMPRQYTLANIPKPKNSAVTLHEVPRQYMVVHRYTGFNTQGRIQEKTQELLAWAQRQSLKVIGTPQLSRYDPPWTLPFMRRHEVVFDVEAKD